ncbi:MAG: hypothetical protein KAI43_05945 [Candidatus Aureabacteria bacterium]|nr:hypothetical protein [Candidatus Auribacterota bacterium]
MTKINTEHTFLMYEGLWRAEGFYFDELNNKIPAQGEVKIIHMENLWINESHIKLFNEKKTEFNHRYEIIPFEEYKEFSTWSSNDTLYGMLEGTFCIIDDTITSIYSSEKGNYRGVEFLLKLSNSVYKSRGCSFKGNSKISSWAFSLYKFEM